MADKTLAEQVAELQELFDTVAVECDRRGQEIKKLTAERDRLRAGQDRWEAERDDFPCCSYGAAPTGYADDDHQDAEVTQWHDSTRRGLTVHDLNVAPEGSLLIRENRVALKVNGTWAETGKNGQYTAPTLISFGWGTARLETGGGDG